MVKFETLSILRDKKSKLRVSKFELYHILKMSKN